MSSHQRTVPRTVIAGLVAVALATFSSPSIALASSPQVRVPAASSSYVFGIVQILNDPFFLAVEQGAKAEAAKLGHITIDVTGPGQNDTAQEIADTKALITKDVSGIILSPGDANAFVPPVQQAKSAGIPVILYNSTLANSSLAISTILSNNYDGALAGGQYLCTALGGMGAKGQVVILEAVTGIPVLNQRWNGFTKGVNQSCPGEKIVAHEITGNVLNTAQSITSSLLVKYPGITGVFADDIVNADGVIRALAAAGKTGKIKVVAFDAEPAEVTALRAGTLDALVAQRAYQEGVDSVQLLWAHIHHQPIPTSVNVGYVLMTKANLASTAKWEY